MKIIRLSGFILGFFLSGSQMFSQLIVDTSNVNKLVDVFINDKSDFKIDKVKFSGNKSSFGIFKTNCKDFPINKGIVISTGNVIEIVGPNNRSNSGTYNHNNGDKELDKLIGDKTFDATAIEFDFIANSDSISFDFVFASEEYPEYVNRNLNDVFAFFVSDSTTNINIALCNGKPISINNINDFSNKGYFIPNKPFSNNYDDCLSYSFQFDGLTTKLSTGLKIKAYKKYHFKICIADVGDGYFDSGVMLRANSFTSSGTKINPDIPQTLFNAQFDSTSIMLFPDIRFGFNSFDVQEQFKGAINELAKYLDLYFDLNVEIFGYTDDIGSDNYNMDLSQKRATSIADVLIKLGIDKKRIVPLGLGKSNNKGKNKDLDRRVMIKLKKNKKITPANTQ